ncbi:MULTISPECIES: dTDP-4-dehydrorhamnose reductase [unclassified Pseudoalteromonas]|uniref:dTDP-4-dehydrorhamnose reductase n=1 Tax=unclassified Pseudoalteromonas TaxID=194690 RepID=UPI0015F7335A|nr:MULTISPECIES: dTDP-4-dehydrorhamnose reductase [unclassified Pseudoalteromonas]MBA6410966.1 dTDP-4-dehydrorhamnose reductase [Pseudoalteromonas sp. 5Ae-yellow]MDN3392167.1 dTDP-4-dehydrorhamnose reductase [Pseudoalteromonas sp. APC 3691]
MKVLITGKDGQVGTSLVTLLNNLPEVTFLALNRAELDITDAKQVNYVVKDFKPNIVINAAAYTAVDKAETEEKQACAINYTGPFNLAVAANNINACLLHISTDYVFSGDKQGLYNEAEPVNPQSIYGKTKLLGENAVAAECPSHIILRTAWVFSEHGNNFVKTMLRLAKTRETLSVVSDQFGGPTYAGDIAKTLITIAQAVHNGNTEFGVYHYSGFPQVSWQQFAAAIFDTALAQGLIKIPVKVNAITTQEYPTPAKRPFNSMLDTRKIANIFAVQPSDWQAALKNIKQYQ